MYCWSLLGSERKKAVNIKNKRSIKHITAIFLMLLLLFTPGCWDRRELEEQAFVEAIGVDQAKNRQMAVTFRISIPAKTGLGQSGGGGGDGEGSPAQKSTLRTTVVAPNIPAAMVLASAYVNRELNLMHTKAIIFGESFAKQGISPVLNFLSRYREMRRNVIVCVAKGEAHQLIDANAPDLEKSYTRYWEGMMTLKGKLGLHPGTLFQNFISGLETAEKTEAMIYLAQNAKSRDKDFNELEPPPSFRKGNLDIKAGDIPRLSGNPVEFLGTAVFKYDKLIDTLNFMETQAYLILNGTFQTGNFNIQDPGNKQNIITLEVKQGTPPMISVDTSEDPMQISEVLSLEGDLIAAEDILDTPDLELLEKAFNEHIKEVSLAMLEKLQKKGADLVGYSQYAKRNFLTRQQWCDFGWSEKFKDAEISLNFEFRLRRTGLQGSPPR